MRVDWQKMLVGQLEFYWDVHLWPRLEGLTDSEYFWEPAAEVPAIAWRMTHIAVGCFADRTRDFFAGPQAAPDPRSAAEALDYLDATYRRWHDAIANADDAAFLAPLGDKGGYYAEDPIAALVVHINREVMHHGGEICLLRDLYEHRG
ncbi:DinB family protein [Pseudonocardiaceae bacterium YIM PH 21723]|nr:DinB family protein [Pseudonocardiaceae bacterium YIM PH 21723]